MLFNYFYGKAGFYPFGIRPAVVAEQ
jgi:hypothetical protein